MTSLYIAHARLRSVALLSAGLATCKSLETLVLRCNKLVELPTSMFDALADCPLRELDVSYNRIASLPTAIGALSQLRVLMMRSNALTTLPRLGDMRLQKIDLSANLIAVWPEAALSGEALEQCRVLLLANNRLVSVPALLLGRLDKLEYLSLRGNPLAHWSKRAVEQSGQLLAEMKALCSRDSKCLFVCLFYLFLVVVVVVVVVVLKF